MSDDEAQVANGTQAPDETSDIPKYDLYIRVWHDIGLLFVTIFGSFDHDRSNLWWPIFKSNNTFF